MRSSVIAVVVVLMAFRAAALSPVVTTAETPPWPTSTVCPPIWCDDPHCSLDYSSGGCPTCLCGDPYCMITSCGPDEECVEYDGCPDGICGACVSIHGTSPETTTGTAVTVCATVECGGPSCSLDYSSGGCPTCLCGDPICNFHPCGPDQECVMNYECPDGICYTCIPLYATTTETTTETPPWQTTTETPPWPTTTFCPDMSWCDGSCSLDYSSGGCPMCLCVDTYCMLNSCGPDEECVEYDGCPDEICGACVSIHGATTVNTTATAPWPNTTVCPTISGCDDQYCSLQYGVSECPVCLCVDPICPGVTCAMDERCELQETTCYPGGDSCITPVCVPATDTTTPCPPIKCAPYPYCVPDTGPDGCPRCACDGPTCQNVTCDPGKVCELQQVQCFTTPCYPVPTCVSVQEYCTGTPNIRRCGRSKYRWSYSSLTGICEKFRYYGCTPSPNTFRSKKSCKNRCQEQPKPAA